MNGGDKGRVKMASNLRFSSFRRRFSPPLLIVYSRQKPVHDDDDGEEEHEDTLQNVDTLEQLQIVWEEMSSKVVENRRQKIDRGQRSMRSDRKKNRNRSGSKTTMRVGRTIQHLLDQSTGDKVPSSRQLINRQNSLMAGDINRRRDERQKQGTSSTTAAGLPGPSKNTAQDRMTVPDAVNVLRRPRRTKRGVLDNEIHVPNNDIGQSDHGPAPGAGYVDPPRSLLDGRTNHQKISSTAASAFTKYEDTERFPDSVFDIRNRKNEKARGKRRKTRIRGRRRNHHSSSLMKLLRNTDDHFSDRYKSMAADSTCKKKRLRVNFADIGWGEWIIAPDFFDAFYCDGFCNFPISRVSNCWEYDC